MACTDKATRAFGRAYTFHEADYDQYLGSTFVVDASARTAVCVTPASGPTVTLGSANSGAVGSATPAGTKTVTLAAGGQSVGGKVTICCWHGGGVVPAGFIGDHA